MTAQLDFSLRLNAAAVSEHARVLETTGRLRLREVFGLASAMALYEELRDSRRWSRSFRQGEAERKVTPDQLSALAPTHLTALEQFALAGPNDGFRWLQDMIRATVSPGTPNEAGPLLAQAAAALNTAETLATLRTIARDPEITRVGVNATRFLTGHFLTRHDDGHEGATRAVAFTLTLSPQWSADWGGLLQFHDPDGDIACGLTPAFNTLQLFRVPCHHSVSQVATIAPVPRISLSGWLYRD